MLEWVSIPWVSNLATGITLGSGAASAHSFFGSRRVAQNVALIDQKVDALSIALLDLDQRIEEQRRSFHRLRTMLEMQGQAPISGLNAPSSSSILENAVQPPSILSSDVSHHLYEDVVEACKTVYHPCIPVNLYDLGLIYTIRFTPSNTVRIVMTAPCPDDCMAGEMPGWVADAIEPLAGVAQVDVVMTFSPSWDEKMMSDEARLELGLM